MKYKRDFTNENLSRIHRYMDEIKEEWLIWDGIVDFWQEITFYIRSFFRELVRSILSIFIKIDDEPKNEELERYYKVVIDKNEELRGMIDYIFEQANLQDKVFSDRGELLLNSGRELLAELNYLIGIATPDGISNIANSIAPNIIILSEFDDISTLSETELIDLCNKNIDVIYSSYLRLITEANTAALDIDGIDIFLVILFNMMDISVDVIVDYLNTSGGEGARKWIMKQILDGTEGFIAVEEIARRIGYDMKIIEMYLETGTLVHNPGINEFNKTNYTHVFADEMAIKNGIDMIIAEHVQMIYSNDKLFEKYCADNNLDAKYLKAIRAEGYSGYERKLYYENLGQVFEKAGKSADYVKNFDLKLSGAKKIIGGITGGKKIWDKTTKEGKSYSEIWKDEKFDAEKAEDYLKKYCGYTSVSKSDIDLFKNVGDNINALGGVSKIIGKSQEGLDAIAYLTADFSQETELLDSIMKTVDPEKNPSYYVALDDLKRKYTDKFSKISEDAFVALEKELINKGIKAVPGVKIVQTALDMARTITGASGYTGAVQDIMVYPGMSNQMLEAYNNSVAAVAAGDETAIKSVRLNFIALKQTLTNYFDKSCEFYSGMRGNINADPKRLAYAQYMSTKVEEMEPGQPFEFLSFDEYFEKYSK